MYEVIEDIFQSEDGVSYTVYGIKCSEGIVADISFDRAKAEHLAALCNTCELHPTHLHEVAQDFLEDMELRNQPLFLLFK